MKQLIVDFPERHSGDGDRTELDEREWKLLDMLKTALDTFIENFNSGYLHSAICYKMPNAFEKEDFEKPRAPLNLAV